MNEEEESKTPSSAPDEESTLADTLEERLATTLYLAGEALVPDLPAEPAHHAVPEDDRDAPIIDDFVWLKAGVALFRQAVAENPKRAELLRLLPQGLGDGEILWVLFQRLFPQQKDKRKVYKNRQGKPQLSESQVEILRLVARGETNPEIAEKAPLPPEIAQKSVNARIQYVGSALQNINRKLGTESRQEAVAVAISMGYLGLDAMDFVMQTGHSGTKDFSVLDSMLTRLGGVENVADPQYWQELSAFGLLLMIASGAAMGPLTFATERLSTNGALVCLERRTDGSYRMRQVVGPGLLRYVGRLAVAPPTAKKRGFSPSDVYVVHNRATLSGRNFQEIVEVSPEGQVVGTFCGGRTQKTSLRGTHGITFAPSGALLATSDNALLRFTEGGRVVQRRTDGCCTDVCADKEGNAYVAHYSTRGGSLRVYSRRGNLKHEFAQQPPGGWFSALRLIETRPDKPGEKWKIEQIVALRWQEQEAAFTEFYVPVMDSKEKRVMHWEDRPIRSWPVPKDSCWSFALDAPANRLYLPNHATKAVHVYSLDGTLQQTIALDEQFTPSHIALGNDGALWLSGVVSDAS